MNDHLAKPIAPERLWATLQRWIVPASALPVPAVPWGQDVAGTVLPAVPGLDLALGLRNAMGRRALYADMLRRFLDGQGGAAGRIASALAGGDTELATREAHTLRGLAGTVGAVALQDCAGRLEDALRDAPDRLGSTGPLVDELRQRLDALVQALQSWRDQPATPPPAGDGTVPSAQADVHRVVEQLHGLLWRDDPAARGFVLDHAAQLRQALGPALPGVQGHIDRFDFEPALAALTGWLARFPQTPAHPPGHRRTGSSHAT